jgi:MFS transporter, AAHS family, vanillate permease
MAILPASPSPQHEILDIARITPVQFGIIFMCFFGMMLDGFDIVIISFTAPGIARDWSVGPEQVGFVFSSGLVGMTCGAMFLSSIADLYGRRILISASLVATGVSTFAVYYANSVTELIGLRFLAGLGMGALMAVLPAMGGEFSPQRHRNFILSIMVSGTSVGSVLGGVISAWAIPEFGWRALYYYTGIVIALSGIVFFLTVPESLQHIIARGRDDALGRINRILAYIGQRQISELPPVSGSVASESASVKSLLTPTRRKMTFLAWGAFGMGFAGMYFMTNWMPKIFVDSGIPEDKSIHAVVILTFGSIIGATTVGWLSRRWALNYLIGIAFAVGTSLILVLSMVIRHSDESAVPIVWALSFLVGITVYGAFANLYSIALTIYPSQVRITGIGWCYGLGRAGAIISPALAGFMIGMGMESHNVLAWFAITIAIAAYFTWRLRVRELT